MINENIEKALHSAELVSDDIQVAYKEACIKNPVLAMLLEDLIAKTTEVRFKLIRIDTLLKEGEND